MERVHGFARIYARAKVEQEAQKPWLFGNPYLKLGQCHVLWGYFFQLGAILGARHSANLDAFGPAFLGAYGPPGAVNKVFTEIAARTLVGSMSDSMKFPDFVAADFAKRAGYTGDPMAFMVNRGMDKIPAKTAEELSWQYSENGAILGATHSDVVRKMFARTHDPVPDDKWQQMRAAGVELPPEQDVMSYAETENGMNDVFMRYCRECCPEFFIVLNK
jgi:hypothetical protein